MQIKREREKYIDRKTAREIERKKDRERKIEKERVREQDREGKGKKGERLAWLLILIPIFKK